ncbi:cation channel sperm-associated auxiliary subunit TMEM249, partial [Peromyscus californicus insignis]|uniref:cation channel sperm-associated auxiliary subunit TMEM249 n=1 Tax=Peromyscus californicus insignis TaxID=564181 RepID=UPI0022A698A9
LPNQVPKEQTGGFSVSAIAQHFWLWALGLFSTERHLARRLKHNSFYPFQQQQPDVFVLEYFLDTLWKGMLLFIFCLVLVCTGTLKQVRGPAPHPIALCVRATQEPPARTHLPINPWCPQVEKQETWCFPAYGMAIGLWLMISSLPRRRLVLNHTRGMYHFSISGRTVCQGPMHLVYVRLTLSSDAYGRCFFQLVLCGHKLEPLVLVQLSERYEQMEFLGRHIARKLNINYFDYLAASYRHVVRHWPLGATFNPGIVHRKAQAYAKSSVTDLDV